MRRVGLIILAAGSSSRLGRPKQLLDFEGRSLILRAAETALRSICRPVIVVLGAFSERIQDEMEKLPVTLAYNSDWQLGMGSSIQTGMAVMEGFETEGVLMMVADQPFISTGGLNQLVHSFLETRRITAAAYDNTLGTPVVFGKNYYRELMILPPRLTARAVIERHRRDVQAIDFPQGTIDIDTEDDYARLINGRPRA